MRRSRKCVLRNPLDTRPTRKATMFKRRNSLARHLEFGVLLGVAAGMFTGGAYMPRRATSFRPPARTGTKRMKRKFRWQLPLRWRLPLAALTDQFRPSGKPCTTTTVHLFIRPVQPGGQYPPSFSPLICP